ncbi:hypothetical protein TPY_0857 [Sulfobacillus acidophilus TPY]|nr:hypothetical protein TPY_0857 [Sulfobacillus acidophilus TPY]
MAQQANPKVAGHTDDLRAQRTILSTDVNKIDRSASCWTDRVGFNPIGIPPYSRRK